MFKTKLVFSITKEQSIFMTVIIGILSFLSILSLGIALSIGTGIISWNTQWNKFATIQITNKDNAKNVQQIIDKNKDKFDSVSQVTTDEMKKMLNPWISSGARLDDYLPIMYEVKLKDAKDADLIKNNLQQYARFLPHNDAVKNSVNMGWKIIALTIMILGIILCSISICVAYIAKNTAVLHKHELEILNQIGATDNFIVNQMQIIVAKISGLAGLFGLIIAVPVLLLILACAHTAMFGMMAMLKLSSLDWIILAILPILILCFAVYITKKTTIKILSKN